LLPLVRRADQFAVGADQVVRRHGANGQLTHQVGVFAKVIVGPTPTLSFRQRFGRRGVFVDVLKPRIDRLGFEGQHAEDAFVNAA
jgi:hypothetical protein